VVLSAREEFFAVSHAAKPRLSAADVLRTRKLRRTYAAFDALFLDATGGLTPDAEIVLRDLVKVSRMGEIGAHLTDAELRDIQGRRTIVLHLLNRLDRDGSRRHVLTEALRENGDG
jgi:hypothetical protein